MKTSNMTYAAIQSLHNVGGALTLALALLLLVMTLNRDATKRILWILASVWGLQGISGALFALSSYYFYGALPEINFLSQTVMGAKIACVAAAFSICTWLIYKKRFEVGSNVKKTLIALPITAQILAAVLRWSS